MTEWIINLGKNEFWIGIGLITTIIGFLITLLTLFIATRISTKISKKIIKKNLLIKYNKNKKSIKGKLEGYQLRLSEDNKLKSFEILTTIYLLEEFSFLFNFIEKFKILKIQNHLKKTKIDNVILIKQMSEIIALLERTKEDNLID